MAYGLKACSCHPLIADSLMIPLMDCGIKKGVKTAAICPLCYPTMHQKRIINGSTIATMDKCFISQHIGYQCAFFTKRSNCIIFYTQTLWLQQASITLTLLRGWWGRCKKKLSPEGGRKGGWRKKARAARPPDPGLEPGTCRVLGEGPPLHARGAV